MRKYAWIIWSVAVTVFFFGGMATILLYVERPAGLYIVETRLGDAYIMEVKNANDRSIALDNEEARTIVDQHLADTGSQIIGVYDPPRSVLIKRK